MAELNNIICFTDDKTIALKRQLVAGDYSSAHSCLYCKRFVVPKTINPRDGKPEVLFKTSMQIDKIHRLAADGCRWFALFSNKLNYIAGIDKKEFAPWEYNMWLPNGSAHSDSVLISMLYESQDDIFIEAHISYQDHSYKLPFYGVKQPGILSNIPRRWNGTSLTHENLDANTYPATRGFLHPINARPASDESIQLFRSWLETCSVKHNCGIQNLPPSLPAFLLAIGKEHVHLMDTAGRPKARYAALSYCWGNKGQNTLLSSKNKQQLLNSIALEQLDTTIQEAIHITRQIGFQYLWIDSLCIPQDDEEMKSSEIARMGEVYRNATLTLIPSRATGVKESFLSNREIAGSSQPNLIFQLPHFDNSSPVQDQTIILIPRETIDYEMGEYTMEEWSKRAWTFQEGIVSPRHLRFGLRQTRWTCRHAETQYMDNDGWISTDYEEASDLIVDARVRNQASQIINQDKKDYQPEQVRSLWNRIVGEYSHLRIKYQYDRLPAIASIAKGFARAFDDDYFCGLWKADLHQQLLWWREVDDDDKDVDRSEDASGFHPSWSWASNRRAIRQSSRQVFKDSDFEVVGCNRMPKSGGDKYGAMESASLQIRALIVSVPEEIINDRRADLTGLSNRPHDVTSNYLRREYGKLSFWPGDELLAEIKREQVSRVNDLSSMLLLSEIYVDNAEKFPSNESCHPSSAKFDDLSLLIVGHEELVHEAIEGPSGGPSGLLISKEENGAYRRLGYFRAGNLWGRKEAAYLMNRTESDTLGEEYRSRMLYLWGGETSVREVTLV
ncbi:hypothetical protein O1611_g608 [Lasiodiplodia mahajangana]|uniref:Uncharacterized protein n=1 Tax=Lasiodiplodia mahajangana TaxID=1108764 RepID=A0ACC2K026_9PEZI|nr:hypothetical protein O1611_g608 [Lasiodiplodia mahajangana]